jgi:membrane-associated phospholipid phosphatase
MKQRSETFLAWPGWRHIQFALLVSLIGVLWFIFVYGGCDAITAHRVARVRIHLDSELSIPFIPETVLIYMSLYLLFLGAPFILRQRDDFLRLALTLNGVILVAGIGFLLVPAQLAFPRPIHLGAFPGVFQFADWLNLDYNLVPSLHVALSVVCVATYTQRVGRTGRILLWIWVAAIATSTLLTHQHHVLDVVTGWALALAAFKIVAKKEVLLRHAPWFQSTRRAPQATVPIPGTPGPGS